MNAPTKIIIASIFIWIGFVGAISFMEAWLKFQAPDVTLSIGLGIGKLVFGALNKVEWMLGILVFGSLFIQNKKTNYLFYGVLVLLILQTIWLLPGLNHRADSIIAGHTLPSSHLHVYYVGMEIVKIGLLITLGIKELKIKK